MNCHDLNGDPYSIFGLTFEAGVSWTTDYLKVAGMNLAQFRTLIHERSHPYQGRIPTRNQYVAGDPFKLEIRRTGHTQG